MSGFVTSAVSIFFDGLAYAMLLFVISVGLSITMGLMGFVNLAHGAFAMAGGYVTVACMNVLGVPFIPALVLTFFFVAIVSIPLERVLYAPLYKARELDQVLMSIGITFMAIAGVTLIFGPNPPAIVLPEFLKGQIDLGFKTFPTYRFFMIVVGFVMAFVLWLGFERTIIGAKIRAAVDNRQMAQAVGIDVDKLFILTFALGSGIAGVGGGLAIDIVGISPVFAFNYLVLFLIVVAVGGLGSLRGAFLAAIVLGVIDTAGKYLWPEGGAFFIYVVTVGVLLVRPNGFFGKGESH
ncbi:branched-chain amino acid ABC transporter permease [Candidatus Dependentiae bacterium]|nr:MAG: branched-chain amino acid ABC transporter permease [Candidatus Dependentiae bacterium]